MSLEEAKVILKITQAAAQLNMLKKGNIGTDPDNIFAKLSDAIDVALTLMDNQLELEGKNE